MRKYYVLAAAGLGFAVSFLAPQTVHAEEISVAEVAAESDAVTETTCDTQEVEAQPEEAAITTTEENTSTDAVVTEFVEDAEAVTENVTTEVSDTDAAADDTTVSEDETASAEASSVNSIIDALPVPEDVVTISEDVTISEEAAVDNTVIAAQEASSFEDADTDVVSDETPVQDDEYYVPAIRPEAPSFEEENPTMPHLASYMAADGSYLSVEGEEPAMVLIYSNEEISVNGIPASMCGDAGETENGEYYALIPVSGNVLVNSTNFRAQIVSGNRGKGSNIVSVYTEDGVLPAPVIPEEPKAEEPETPVVDVPEEPKHEEPKAEEPKTPVVDVPEEPKHEEPKIEEPETPEVVVPEEPKHEEPKAEEPKTPEVTVPETPVVTVESSEKEEAPVREEVFAMIDDDMETEVITADTDDQVVVEPVIHTDRVLPQTGDESYNMQLLLVLFMISGAAIIVWNRKNINNQ